MSFKISQSLWAPNARCKPVNAACKHPSGLSAVLRNTGAPWCSWSFPPRYTNMLLLAASGKHVLAANPLPPPLPPPTWSGGLTATVASYVIHFGTNGVLREKWHRRPRRRATAPETFVWQENIYYICRPVVCRSSGFKKKKKDGLTEIIFYFYPPTGAQHTILFGVMVVGGGGQGGGPFVT